MTVFMYNYVWVTYLRGHMKSAIKIDDFKKKLRKFLIDTSIHIAVTQ